MNAQLDQVLASSTADKKLASRRSSLQVPTIRFDVSLEKPTSDVFSEINYNKLVLKALKALKRKAKKSKSNGSHGSSGGDLVALAKKDCHNLDYNYELVMNKLNATRLLSMYRKKLVLSKKLDACENDSNDSSNMRLEQSGEYEDESDSGGDSRAENSPVGGVGRNHKNKRNYDFDMNKYKLKNFANLGMGYDESDSFIDNSEAHDANIPKNMVPTRGGFYINGEAIQLRPKGRREKPQDSSRQRKKGTNGRHESGEERSEADEEAEGTDNVGEEMDDEDAGEEGDEDEDDEGDDESNESEDDDELDSTLTTDDSSTTSLDEDDENTTMSGAASSSGAQSVIEIVNGDSNLSAASKRKKNKKQLRIDDEDENEVKKAAATAPAPVASQPSTLQSAKLQAPQQLASTPSTQLAPSNKENEKNLVLNKSANQGIKQQLPQNAGKIQVDENRKKRKIDGQMFDMPTTAAAADVNHSNATKQNSLSPSENILVKKKRVDGATTTNHQNLVMPNQITAKSIVTQQPVQKQSLAMQPNLHSVSINNNTPGSNHVPRKGELTNSENYVVNSNQQQLAAKVGAVHQQNVLQQQQSTMQIKSSQIQQPPMKKKAEVSNIGGVSSKSPVARIPNQPNSHTSPSTQRTQPQISTAHSGPSQKKADLMTNQSSPVTRVSQANVQHQVLTSNLLTKNQAGEQNFAVAKKNTEMSNIHQQSGGARKSLPSNSNMSSQIQTQGSQQYLSSNQKNLQTAVKQQQSQPQQQINQSADLLQKPKKPNNPNNNDLAAAAAAMMHYAAVLNQGKNQQQSQHQQALMMHASLPLAQMQQQPQKLPVQPGSNNSNTTKRNDLVTMSQLSQASSNIGKNSQTNIQQQQSQQPLFIPQAQNSPVQISASNSSKKSEMTLNASSKSGRSIQIERFSNEPSQLTQFQQLQQLQQILDSQKAVNFLTQQQQTNATTNQRKDDGPTF